MIALVVATAELALVAALGSWTKWLIIHGAVATIALIIFLMKTSRGLFGGRGRGLGGLLGKRGLGGMLGGHGPGHGGRGNGRGLGGLLGGRGGHGPGHGGRGTGLGRAPGLGGLFGKRGHNPGHTSGRNPGGLLGGRGNGRGLGGLLGGRGGHGPSGHGGGGLGSGSTGGREHGPSGRGGNLGGLFGKGGKPADKRTDDPDRPGPLARAAREFKDGWDKAGPKDRKSKDEPEDEEPEEEEPEEEDEDEDDKPADKPADKPTDKPADSHGGSKKMVKTHGTPSLQAWGRCLPTVEAALLEKQRELRRVEADLEGITQAVTRLHDQGEQELPASPKLISLLADVQASMKRLPRLSEAIARIASTANALGPMYRAEHMGDEDRLAGMRGGVDREKRSDVGEAQRDT